MSFVCNITGKTFDLVDDEKDRESAIRFGFNSRFRALWYVFCKLFYGECEILNSVKCKKSLKGIGISDYNALALIFEKNLITQILFIILRRI